MKICHLIAGAALSFALIAHADNDVPKHAYSTGWSSVSKLAFDIHGAMKGANKEKIHEQPVSLETDTKPFVKLEEYADEKKPLPMIFISLGFVDLINNISHAKAISAKDKKYFQKYIESLAGETGETELKDLPGIEKDEYWTDDMMNEEISNFNSIAGMLVSINFAHHYLGQFKKHEKEIMTDQGNTTPINKVLTADEYEAAFAAGVRSAMDAGILTEGMVTFLEALDKMKTRPAWAVYFMPETVKFAKLKKTMAKIQSDFFAGKN